MTINLTALQKQRYDTAANWTGANPTLLAGEIGIESDTLRWKVGNGSTAWTSLGYIPGLAYGTARQLLQTNSGATAAEWTSNVDIPGTLDVTGTSTLDGMVLMGTTTSIGGGKLQLSSDTTTTIQNFSFNATADSSTAMLQFIRGRGTKASPSVVLNGDYLGEIRFLGYGTTYNTGASIRAIVDGDPATAGDTSDMPTKLVFLTSPNGSSTPDTRMTIDSAGLVTIPGDLTVNGTTTTINSTTLVVQDKNIEMGVVATPTDVTADGGGITLKGTTDKTINWIDATDAWTLSEHVNIASAKEYRIAGTKVLDATSLGSAVVSSSLTSVGTIGTGVWQGTAIADTYLGTISTALKVSNSATTATSSNTASAIVARDASGNFTAGTITASLTGTASGNLVSGGALGTPSSGTLTNCTFPTLNQNTTGNAATVTTNANLTGDVTSVGNATSIAAGVIVDADINASAAIVDTKLATIATAGKVSNSATTATDANTASAIVARDASGNFTAGTITAALTGAASSNVLKAGDTMTGVLAVTAGTAALPAITPSGDPNTGIYSPGADQLAISTNGVQRLSIGSTGNIDLDSNTVFVDAVNNRLGIGTSSPNYELHVNASDATNFIQLTNSGTGTGVSDGFLLYNNGVNATVSNQEAGYLAFETSGQNRIHILSDGKVGIGTSSPGRNLHVAGSSATALIESTGSTNADLLIGDGGVRYYGIRGVAGGGSLQIRNDTANTTLATFTSTGLVGIGTTSPAATLHSRADNAGSGSTPLLIQNASVSANTAVGISFAPNTANTADRSAVIYGVNSSGGSGNATDLTFHTNANGGSPTEKARLDASGRLLVGTPTASGFISIAAQGSSNSTTGPAYLQLRRGALPSNTHSLGWIQFADNSSNVGAQIHSEASQNWTSGSAHGSSLVFSTTADGASSPTERMRISNNGELNLFVTNIDGFQVRNSLAAGTSRANFVGRFSATDTLSGTVSYLVYTNGNVQNTNNSYGALSDIKLKENIVDANSQWDDIKALQVRNYNLKEGQTHRQIGLIAQEVDPISPGLVYESPDRDEDGNDLGTVTKSVNYSVLYMKAVKALQEAMERIETLEAKVAALESA